MTLRDPYRNFKFEVEIAGFTRAGFSMIGGLKQTTEVIEYREGGENETPRKIPGQTSFDNATFERGMSAEGSITTPGIPNANGGDIPNWGTQILQLDADAANPPGTDGASSVDFRRDVVVYLKNKSGERVWKWTLLRAWPAEMEYGDLDAKSNELIIEKMSLAYEGLKSEKLLSGPPM